MITLKVFFAAFITAVIVSLTAASGHAANAFDKGAEAQFSYAGFLTEAGDYAGGAREYGRFIERFPGNSYLADAQFRMACAYLNAGMFKEAQEEFDLFLSNYPQSASVLSAAQKLQEAKSLARLASLPVTTLPNINYLSSGGRLRAVQIMNFTSKDYAGVEEELRSLKAAGVNAIILRVFHNKDDRFYPSAIAGASAGVYFKSANAPVVDDVLGKALPIARRNGIKVFAWMTTRYADYGIEDDESVSCKAYDISAAKMTGCKGLDLFNERAVARLEAIYSDLAAYPIDGVLFQDDLVLRHNEGFGSEMSELFKTETGKTIDPAGLYVHGYDDEAGQTHYTPLFWEWAAWKNRRLLNVAARLRDTVRKKRPQTLFAINLMYESLTNPANALAWLSQSFSTAVSMGFDYYSIMAYHRQMGDELRSGPTAITGIIEKMVVDAAVMTADPSKVLIKLQTIDWNTGEDLPTSEVAALIRKMKSNGGVSIAVVPYRPDFPFQELGDRVVSRD